jgi:hypothetical protein
VGRPEGRWIRPHRGRRAREVGPLPRRQTGGLE